MSERLLRVARIGLRVVGVGALLAFLVMTLMRGHGHLVGNGEKAPQIVGIALDGGPVDVGLGDGRVTVVNLWGTWCPPCMGELPDLIELAHKYEGKVRFVGLEEPNEGSGGLKDVRKVVERYKIPYDVAIMDGATIAAWHGEWVPATYIVDGEGIVRWGTGGAISKDVLERKLKPYLKD